jgi:hypothetical protein
VVQPIPDGNSEPASWRMLALSVQHRDATHALLKPLGGLNSAWQQHLAHRAKTSLLESKFIHESNWMNSERHIFAPSLAQQKQVRI